MEVSGLTHTCFRQYRIPILPGYQACGRLCTPGHTECCKGIGANSSNGAEKTAGRSRASAPKRPIGCTALPKEEWTVPDLQDAESSSDGTENNEPSGALPEVSRGRIFGACWQTGAVLSVLALLLRGQAQSVSLNVLHTDPRAVEALLHSQLELRHVGAALAACVGVTAARALLLQAWPAFAEASYRSNQQVLSPLRPWDLAWLACITGISEELLFRGALIPALYPDWRGVLLSAGLFGALHNSGGRNPAFAVWSGAVGALYGAVFLYTKDVYVPMAAHSLANVASGLLWFRMRKQLS